MGESINIKDLELRKVLKGKELKKYLVIKKWLDEDSNGNVVSILINDKYQELKKGNHI